MKTEDYRKGFVDGQRLALVNLKRFMMETERANYEKLKSWELWNNIVVELESSEPFRRPASNEKVNGEWVDVKN